ncbi:hypothetical protein EVAR_79250_1 [Eumeta japonica]|uniref:Uncharacterized protein n=1 Tax=Eumeta variegata TaxID=151549 RepID=A0A4C1THY0_EUMVA|nr:hypothetical protein EVAR_79250_1 [Eumeta japonica]
MSLTLTTTTNGHGSLTTKLEPSGHRRNGFMKPEPTELPVSADFDCVLSHRFVNTSVTAYLRGISKARNEFPSEPVLAPVDRTLFFQPHMDSVVNDDLAANRVCSPNCPPHETLWRDDDVDTTPVGTCAYRCM